VKKASSYPKLEFRYTPRRAYFFNLHATQLLPQDFVPNPMLRQQGRVRDLNFYLSSGINYMNTSSKVSYVKITIMIGLEKLNLIRSLQVSLMC